MGNQDPGIELGGTPCKKKDEYRSTRCSRPVFTEEKKCYYLQIRNQKFWITKIPKIHLV